MVLTLFGMTTLALVAASSLLVGAVGLKATRNYRGASQVHFSAESAVSEAMQRINGPGVVHFENDVVNQWDAIWGAGSHAMSGLAGFRYRATVSATPGNEASAGRIVAEAIGPEGVRNTVVATVVRSNIPATAPGALYLASDGPTDARFNGNSFLIDGSDQNFTGGAGAGNPVPGISTRNATNTQEAVDSLGGAQLNNVLGLGFQTGPPTVASVLTSPAAPSVAQLHQIAEDILARPGVVVWSGDHVNGDADFGTSAAPQITHFTSPDGLTMGNGNASGAGIMIVDGDLRLNGTLDFKGLIIVRGRTTVTGTATVYGSVWTSDIHQAIGGNAVIQYSTQALALANQVGGGGALPSPILVTSLADCALVPSGVSGCP